MIFNKRILTLSCLKPLQIRYSGFELSSFDIKAGEKVAIVGANGTGKSSMLKDIYESMKSDAYRIGYYTQIFDDDSEQLSGGERNIKQLRALCESDAEILFLDEPSSHLDTYAQIALEKAIKEYQGTVLMVTHDFYTFANCADLILLLENGTVREQSGRAYRSQNIFYKYSCDMLCHSDF